jgi:hypothetical protein
MNIQELKCSKCKHFDNNNTDRHGYGYCNKADSIDGRPVNKTLAYARDTEEYKAYLKVHKDFGCIQFERKCTHE